MHNNNGFNPMLTSDDAAPYTLSRPTIRKPAPTITLTNGRTRQTTLFDDGGNDLPGQKHLFDDITQEPTP